MKLSHLNPLKRLLSGVTALAVLTSALAPTASAYGMPGKHKRKGSDSELESFGNTALPKKQKEASLIEERESFFGLPVEIYQEILKHLPFKDLLQLRLVNKFCSKQTLTTLDLSKNKIGAAVAAVFANTTTLTTLRLWKNQIGDAGAQALATNTTLTTLNLSNNQVGDAGAQALAQKNTTLTQLDLSNNQVGDAGAQALATNTTLTTLDLSENKIGDAGAQALATNTTLTTLDLSENQIDDGGAQAFVNNLRKMNLKNLNLNGNNLSDSLKQTIRNTTYTNAKGVGVRINI